MREPLADTVKRRGTLESALAEARAALVQGELIRAPQQIPELLWLERGGGLDAVVIAFRGEALQASSYTSPATSRSLA